jgi:hypothetical protein
MIQVYGRGDLPSTEIEVLCYPALAGFHCSVTALLSEWIKSK